MNTLKSLLAGALLSSLTVHANAASLTAEQIVQKAELAAYYAGDDGRSGARMLIVDGQGRKQMRQFAILRKDQQDGGSQDMLVFFSRPSDVKGTVFRVVKHVDGDDDRWLYLPDLDLVKRISAGDKRTSFVGSHFFYEDVSGRNTSQDNFELVNETDSSYTIKATPKDPSSVEFAHYQVDINKANFLPSKIDFYDPQGKLYRSVETLEVKDVDGHPTVTKSKISDHNTGGYTLMEFKFTTYDLGLPQTIFSERSLRNPPRKWLKLR